MFLVTSPYPQLFDLDGSPLDGGQVYFGNLGTNPLIPSNRIPIFWDAAGTQPAVQPVSTSNGYMHRSGTPSSVFADIAYSMVVYDNHGKLVSYSPDAQAGSGFSIGVDLTDPDKGSAIVAHRPEGIGTVPTTVKSELERRWTPYNFGAVDGQDASDALDKFAAHVLLNPTLLYDVTGDFLISRPWLFYHPGVKSMRWNLTLTTTAPMSFAVALEGTYTHHIGQLRVNGPGTANVWSSRTLDWGVVVSGCQGSTLPEIFPNNVKFWGVTYNEDGTLGIPLRAGQAFKNNTVLSLANGVDARSCGGYNTGYSGGGPLNNLGFLAEFSSPVRNGTAGSNTQSTTLQVSELPPLAITSSNPVTAVINGRPFKVLSSSGTSGFGTVELFPWMPPEWTTGTISYTFGGALNNIGSNGGPTKIGKIDAATCGAGLNDAALYGSVGAHITVQFCPLAILHGSSVASISPQSSSYVGVYTEAVLFNMVTQGSGSAYVLNRYGAFSGDAYLLCEKLYPRGDTGNEQNYNTTGMSSIVMPGRSSLVNLRGIYSKRPGNFINSQITISPSGAIPVTYKRDGWIINFSDPTNTNVTDGLDSGAITMFGTGVRNAPTSTFTFNPPEGWTVNGVSSVVIDSFAEPADFRFFWEIATKNILLRCVSRRGRTAIPTTGDWLRGDVLWNTLPAEGGVAGWICITAGTPGVWIPFGGVRGLTAYTPTNVTTDRAFDADTVVVTELADIVGTLIADLKASGVLK